jgi:hypothetical protein
MKFYIDISLFTESSGAYGNITGTIDLPACPCAGNIISFSVPLKTRVKPITIKEFSGHLTIMKVIFGIGEKETISLALDDITVKNKEDANLLVTYLSSGFDLFFDEYINS